MGRAVVASTILSAGYFLLRANRLVGLKPGRYAKSVLWPGIVPYIVAAFFAPAAYWALGHLNRWAAAGCIAGIGAVYSLGLLFVIHRFVFEAGERLWFEAVLAQKLNRFRGLRTPPLAAPRVS